MPCATGNSGGLVHSAWLAGIMLVLGGCVGSPLATFPEGPGLWPPHLRGDAQRQALREAVQRSDFPSAAEAGLGG